MNLEELKQDRKVFIPQDFEEMTNLHLDDHAILLEMINTLAEHLGGYLQPKVVGDEELSYEFKHSQDKKEECGCNPPKSIYIRSCPIHFSQSPQVIEELDIMKHSNISLGPADQALEDKLNEHTRAINELNKRT